MVEKIGGREGIRTPDPLLAKQVLSQLSYTPTVEIPHSKISAELLHHHSSAVSRRRPITVSRLFGVFAEFAWTRIAGRRSFRQRNFLPSLLENARSNSRRHLSPHVDFTDR